ncbi:MAG: nucleoside deaminase [Pirellulales bacterium]|jgi:guanine deaminase|nr:nucleoside deaminase [Pirellulales bacterium]
MEPELLMQMAIEAARRGVNSGQTPFGCAIARDGDVLSVEHNTVWSTTDITAHAEVNALRSACRSTGEILLTGSVAATTCEPCPMCMAALHWGRVETVYFGASIADAEQAGFNELNVSSEQMVSIGGSDVKLVPGLMAEQCRELFREWLENDNRQSY